jgi:hypothetical protein
MMTALTAFLSPDPSSTSRRGEIRKRKDGKLTAKRIVDFRDCPPHPPPRSKISGC